MTTDATPTGPSQYLSFFVSGEEYAVSILSVRELVQYVPITYVPNLPPFVRGVANLRGSVVPVVDLARKFQLGETPITKWTCIVMLEVETDGQRSVVGVLADTVSQVLELSPSDIEPAPAFGTRPGAAQLEGMAQAGQKFVLLLDVRQLLTLPQPLVAEAAVEPSSEPEDPAADAPPQPLADEPLAATPAEAPASASSEAP